MIGTRMSNAGAANTHKPEAFRRKSKMMPVINAIGMGSPKKMM